MGPSTNLAPGCPSEKVRVFKTYVDEIVTILRDSLRRVKSYFLFTPCGDPNHTGCGTPTTQTNLCNQLAARAYKYMASRKRPGFDMTDGESSFAAALRADYPQFVWSVIIAIEQSGEADKEADYCWFRRPKKDDKDGQQTMWIQQHSTGISRGFLGKHEKLLEGSKASGGLKYGRLICCREYDTLGWMRMTILWTEARNVLDSRDSIVQALMQKFIHPEKVKNTVNEGLEVRRLDGSLARASQFYPLTTVPRNVLRQNAFRDSFTSRVTKRLAGLKLNRAYRDLSVRFVMDWLATPECGFDFPESDMKNLLSLLGTTVDGVEGDDDGAVLGLFEVAMHVITKGSLDEDVPDKDAYLAATNQLQDALLDTVPLLFLQQMRLSRGNALFDLASVNGVTFPRVYPQCFFENNLPTAILDKEQCVLFWPLARTAV